jgi:hypothetical protein
MGAAVETRAHRGAPARQFAYEPKVEDDERQPPPLFDCVAVKSGFGDRAAAPPAPERTAAAPMKPQRERTTPMAVG